MRRTPTLLLALALGAALAAPALGQGAARLYGYEKPSFVGGTVTLDAGRGEVAVRGFSSRYGGPLVLLLASGFDSAGAVRVGELAPGFSGDATFPLPAGAAGADTVMVMVPADPIPVGVGLLRRD